MQNIYSHFYKPGKYLLDGGVTVNVDVPAGVMDHVDDGLVVFYDEIIEINRAVKWWNNVFRKNNEFRKKISCDFFIS